MTGPHPLHSLVALSRGSAGPLPVSDLGLHHPAAALPWLALALQRHKALPRACAAGPQVCVILFQQLHYYDTPSLVRAVRAGRWHEVLGSGRKVELASDAW